MQTAYSTNGKNINEIIGATFQPLKCEQHGHISQVDNGN